MKILIFGASGATGMHLVQQALNQGHHVTAFVRDSQKLKSEHPRLTITEGNICDLRTVHQSIFEQGAVISALGANQMFKFDETVVSGISTILSAMALAKTDRFIYLSTLGVSETRSNAGFMIRALAPTILSKEVEGHEFKEKIVRNSNALWTIVRAPILTNGALTCEYRSGESIKATSFAPKLSRADVAHFMLSQLSDERFIKRCVSLMP